MCNECVISYTLDNMHIFKNTHAQHAENKHTTNHFAVPPELHDDHFADNAMIKEHSLAGFVLWLHNIKFML